MNKKFKISLLVNLVFLGYTLDVFASNQTGKIVKLQVRDDGLHWFILEGEKVGVKPGCAIYDYWMIKDENSAYGKSQYAMLLMAYSSGKAITVQGANSCQRWGDGEDVSTIILQ